MGREPVVLGMSAKRDGSSYAWTSTEHTFTTGEIMGTLAKEGFRPKPVLTLNEDYTATIEIERHGKKFLVIVAEVE